jgi:hypothetical protein
LRSHLLNLLIYSTLVSAYFGILIRRRPGERIRLASIIWAAMVGGAIVLAFLMYPFPR